MGSRASSTTHSITAKISTRQSVDKRNRYAQSGGVSRYCHHVEPRIGGGAAQRARIRGAVRELLRTPVWSFPSPRSSDHSSRIRVATRSCVLEGRDGLDATDACDCGALWCDPSALYSRKRSRRGRLL